MSMGAVVAVTDRQSGAHEVRPATVRTETIDLSAFPLPVLLRSLWARTVILSNARTLRFPADVRQEIEAAGHPHESLTFEVKVNPALDSGVRVHRVAGNRLQLILAVTVRRVARALRALCLRPTRTSTVSAAPPAGGRAPAMAPSRRVGIETSAMDWCRQRLPVQQVSQLVSAGPKLRAYVLVHALEHLKRLAFPAGLHVALTTYCDLKCVMCPYHAEDLRKQHTTRYFEDGKRMPAELLVKIIEEAGRAGANLGFGEYDEPFMYKGFTDYAVLAKEKGCTVSITTNGTQLTRERAERLIRVGVDHISFSLDAATAETYRKIRLSDFSVPLENLRTLLQVREALHGTTVVRACLVVQPGNEHEQELFRDRMKQLGVDIVSFYVLSKYENGVWRNARLNFDIGRSDPGERYPCSQLWSQMAIYPDGQVALCCATTLYVGYRTDVPYVGNIKDSSLQEIWLSANYRKIRAEALAGIFGNSVCRDCEIWYHAESRERTDAFGHRVHENPYETFVYLK